MDKQATIEYCGVFYEVFVPAGFTVLGEPARRNLKRGVPIIGPAMAAASLVLNGGGNWQYAEPAASDGESTEKPTEAEPPASEEPAAIEED
jgi:hypothetical protein